MYLSVFWVDESPPFVKNDLGNFGGHLCDGEEIYGEKEWSQISQLKVGSQWKRMCHSVWYARNVSVQAP